MSRHTKYIQKMLNDLDNGIDEVVSPDRLVKFLRIYDVHENLCVYHYGTLIMTMWENGYVKIGEGAYSDTDVRIINQVLEHYKMEVVAHRKKDVIYLE